MGFGETFARLVRYGGEMPTTMLEEIRERRLVERARKGDRQAFEALFSTLRERLLATIQTQMGPAVRQRVDSEDVLQDAFLRALRSIDSFEWRGEGSFCRWLEGIASHLVLDAGRRQARRQAIRIERDLTGDGVSPSKGLRRDERSERLQRCIESLSPDYRTVLRMARLEGRMIKDIAEVMGRSESAVKNLLLRATRALKRSFGDTESLHLGEHHDAGEGYHGS